MKEWLSCLQDDRMIKLPVRWQNDQVACKMTELQGCMRIVVYKIKEWLSCLKDDRMIKLPERW